ncbi:MAG: HupE/UreJ family protein [Hyphomicrobiales bacterium]
MNALRLFILAATALLWFAATDASAHTQSYGFLTVTRGEERLEGRIELAVRDLDAAYDLDADRDGKITWGEFRRREAELKGAVLAGISIGAEGSPCALTAEPALTDSRGGETYIVIPFRSPCPQSAAPFRIGYNLLFNINAQHRGLVAVTTASETKGFVETKSFVMTPGAAAVSLGGTESGARLFLSFIGHGIHHIWIGYDHILFLITLLLGTLAANCPAGRMTSANLKSALVAAVKVVTAFTLSHSFTLALAAFGVLRIPVALTESLIAATISLAAFNNIWPLVSRRLWLVAFVFGLIHGVGFANVLAELELPRDSLLTALLAFNIGVELGQLTIVFAALPLAALALRYLSTGRAAFPAANLAIAAVGAAWFTTRAFGIAILPF